MGMTKNEKYMRWCIEGAKLFSTCGKRNYMAIILSHEGRVVGTGYNGGPAGTTHCVDGGCPRLAACSPSGSSYDNCIALHAEQNALLYSDRSERLGGTLYVNGPPCYTCSKLIVGSGVFRLVFLEDPLYTDFGRCLNLFEQCGIEAVALSL